MKIPNETYRSGESFLAENLWKKNQVTVVTSDDEFTIHAWICGAKGFLWHVYVPPQLRQAGVAKALVEMVCGKEYQVHKPWPNNGQPHGHLVRFNPYMSGV